MSDPPSLNRAILVGVARRIAPLLGDVVFVGGQVAELLITSRGATRVRATVDVDIVVAASTRLEYAEVEARLRTLGLTNDSGEGAPICRWKTPEGFRLDAMPAAGNVLGFSNRWYPAAIAQATPFDLGDGLLIQIPTAPVFLATKWEAFANRGESDLLSSHDIEDIVSVLAGRPEIVAEVAGSPADLRVYLARHAQRFLSHDLAVYAVRGALPDAARIPDLVNRTMVRIREMADVGEGPNEPPIRNDS